MTVLQAEWLADLEAQEVSPRTLETYREALRRLERLTGRLPEHFGPLDCKAVYLAKSLSSSTRRLTLLALRMLHKWLRREGHRSSRTARTLELPKPRKPKPRPFRSNEIYSLRRAAREMDIQWAAYFFVLDATGCRARNPLHLDARDIEGLWRTRNRKLVIHFDKSKTGPYSSPVWDIACHGRRPAKLLPIVLERYRKAMGLSLSGPLFPYGPLARKRTIHWIKLRWRKQKTIAGVTGTLDQVRHTFATEELERTRDIARVSRWLNHSRLDMTARYARYLGLLRVWT